jgi:hypothetical protein
MAATVETIAQAYLAHAGGNAGEALREAIADALADLCEAGRRTRRVERLISRGYVRGQVGQPMVPGLLLAVAADGGHAVGEAAA